MSTPSPKETAAARDAADPAPDTAGLGRDDVAHLARLSRLALSDEELDHFAGQLSAVLDAVAAVGKADVEDVPPMTHAVPLTNVTRPDVVTPSLPRDVVLSQAPAAEDDRFRVPQILGEEE
ncbi:Asp-tRNA(Asn)/Glu-tRNA(Gln) amidotransferase subunit GatC [Geodermatophilus sp. SYSU D01105]